MKQRYFTAAIPAVLTGIGVLLSWTNLRFPDTIPSGVKLFFLLLLILLWLVQIGMEKIAYFPLITFKLNMFSTRVATAFYGLSAIESFRLFREHHQPLEDWIMLAVSMLIALIVIAACLMPPAVRSENKNKCNPLERKG